MGNDRKYNFSYISFFLAAVLILTKITIAADQPKAFLDTDAILKGWESNYGSIRNMEVSYSSKVLDYNSTGAEIPQPLKDKKFGKFMYQDRIEDVNCFHVRLSTAEDGFAKAENIDQYAFDGQNTFNYFAKSKEGAIVKGLTEHGKQLKNLFLEFLLLDKIYSEKYPNGILDFSMILSAPKTTVLPNLETVANQPCHVIETTFENGKSKIWVAHEKGFIPLKYELYNNNKLVHLNLVEQLGLTKNGNNSIWYPTKIKRTVYSKFLGTMIADWEIHKFLPNISIDKNSFQVVFPQGTKIGKI